MRPKAQRPRGLHDVRYTGLPRYARINGLIEVPLCKSVSARESSLSKSNWYNGMFSKVVAFKICSIVYWLACGFIRFLIIVPLESRK